VTNLNETEQGRHYVAYQFAPQPNAAFA